MSDIVEQLREISTLADWKFDQVITSQAADEIERLRRQIRMVQTELMSPDPTMNQRCLAILDGERDRSPRSVPQESETDDLRRDLPA